MSAPVPLTPLERELLDALRAMESWGTRMCRVPRPNSPLAQARRAIAAAEAREGR